jgi:hypothetical protein
MYDSPCAVISIYLVVVILNHWHYFNHLFQHIGITATSPIPWWILRTALDVYECYTQSYSLLKRKNFNSCIEKEMILIEKIEGNVHANRRNFVHADYIISCTSLTQGAAGSSRVLGPALTTLVFCSKLNLRLITVRRVVESTEKHYEDIWIFDRIIKQLFFGISLDWIIVEGSCRWKL